MGLAKLPPIDTDLFRTLYLAGLPYKEIARVIQRTPAKVSGLARTLDLPPRGRTGTAVQQGEPAPAPEAPAVPLSPEAALLATGGRYAALAEYAAAAGISAQAALQQWHRIRVTPVGRDL